MEFVKKLKEYLKNLEKEILEEVYEEIKTDEMFDSYLVYREALFFDKIFIHLDDKARIKNEKISRLVDEYKTLKEELRKFDIKLQVFKIWNYKITVIFIKMLIMNNIKNWLSFLSFVQIVQTPVTT